jgi:hypothetical protein
VPVNAEIFRDDEYLSFRVTERLEPKDQLTASKTHHKPALNINMSLHTL